MSDKEEEAGGIVDAEEEVKGNWEVKVNLPEVKLVTGEEAEEPIYKHKTKLYRFKDGQWKERSNGEFKLLRHKTTHKIRFLMRQEKTLTIMANHYITEAPFCELSKMAASDKAFTWLALDCSEGSPANEKFALRFQTVETALKFKQSFEDAKKFNGLLKAGKTQELVYAPVVVEIEEKKEVKVEVKEDAKKAEKAKEIKEVPIKPIEANK